MNMQTGFGDDGSSMIERYIASMTDILLPVMEKSMVFAAEYSKACGRNTLLPEDIEYAIKYCAMYTVGQDVGTLFPELYDEEDSDEEDLEEVAQEDCPEFVRYSGTDERFILMNEAYDRWDSWVPQNPTERMLKNAINSNEHL
jgi:histone H3/H4